MDLTRAINQAGQLLADRSKRTTGQYMKSNDDGSTCYCMIGAICEFTRTMPTKVEHDSALKPLWETLAEAIGQTGAPYMTHCIWDNATPEQQDTIAAIMASWKGTES